MLTFWLQCRLVCISLYAADFVRYSCFAIRPTVGFGAAQLVDA